MPSVTVRYSAVRPMASRVSLSGCRRRIPPRGLTGGHPLDGNPPCPPRRRQLPDVRLGQRHGQFPTLVHDLVEQVTCSSHGGCGQRGVTG